MNANILSINRMRFGTDGEGVRTLVGFYGCPLRCKYCINPMSWNGTVRSKVLTPKALLEKVRVDNLYFLSSGGGITFGGGEPLLYSDFICEFISIAPKGWTFNIETSLHVDFESIKKVAHFVDLFIVDIKSCDNDIYNSYTGGNCELVKSNLKRLLDMVGSDKILVRVPFIKDFTTEDDVNNSVLFLKEMGINKIDSFDYITDLNS